MTKSQAISLFGSISLLCAALKISRQAVHQWPELLTQKTADRVRGAKVRLGGKRHGD